MRKILSFAIFLAIMFSLCSCGLFRPAGEWHETNSPARPDPAVSTDTPMNESQTVATTEPVPTVEPARVSFVGCGDNIIYYGNVREAATKAPAGRQYGFAYSYDRVRSIIEGADVAFINQETLMCGEGYELSYYPTFNSPQDVGLDLVEVGFDVVNIANNHMVDKGGAGLEKTIGFWKTQPVLMIGGYESEEDFNTPRYLESGGLKIAFLSYADHTNGIPLYDGYNAWAPYLDEKDTSMAQSGIISDEAIATITQQVTEAKQNAEIVIVSVHWGAEGAFKPSEEQSKFAKLFADLGVDVIVGHHPHVIQPVQWIEGEGGNKTLCVYSLGNFMAEQAYDYNMVGGMISFDMVRSDKGETSIENVQFIPTVFHHNASFYNNQVWLMEEYTADMAANHGISYYGNRTTLDKLKKYVTDTVSPEFLPDFLK
ncbi:MAG: CapA family protein [Clostridia bacterium]|nr:CapA family protein [Clostridia bacterium]